MGFDFVDIFRDRIALVIFARELVPAKTFGRARARVVEVEYQDPAFGASSVEERRRSIDQSVVCCLVGLSVRSGSTE